MKQILADCKKFFGKKLPLRITFMIMGIASTLWFLIRVIPKPTRAGYPCMRAAAPIMSAFVIYLISISSSVMAFRHFRKNLIASKYKAAFGFFLITIALVYFAGSGFNQKAEAIQLADEVFFTANNPIGVPKGLHPGRVVWVWDEDATDESCINDVGDYWFDNTNQGIVDEMLVQGIQNYAGNTDTKLAWDAIFRHFNSNHEKGDVGYVAGEKVYVKINLTNSCCGMSGTTKTGNLERMDATPELVLAILKQLIEEVGVAQSDIYLGDPFRTFRDNYYSLCHGVYPNVNYADGGGINGRYKTIPTSQDIMIFSDKVLDYRIPQEYVDADYFINMPCLKSHDSGGITLAAKNHQGSILQDGAGTDDQSAYDMHYALPDHDATDGGNHRYRHLVDYMGHEHLGGKTLLVIIDGIWAGKSWEGFVEKWQMAPFNNDFPNSLFISQDLVAIESVCWDFLLEEYKNKSSNEKYPYMDGVEDYILQAADPANWPAGFQYDPEGDGSILGSLGVYEHWDNADSMRYTVIDFVKVIPGILEPETTTLHKKNNINLTTYPNPVSDQLFIEYILEEPAHVSIDLYNINGSILENLKAGNEYTGSQQLIWKVDNLSAGIYLIKVEIDSKVLIKRIQVL